MVAMKVCGCALGSRDQVYSFFVAALCFSNRTESNRTTAPTMHQPRQRRRKQQQQQQSLLPSLQQSQRQGPLDSSPVLPLTVPTNNSNGGSSMKRTKRRKTKRLAGHVNKDRHAGRVAMALAGTVCLLVSGISLSEVVWIFQRDRGSDGAVAPSSSLALSLMKFVTKPMHFLHWTADWFLEQAPMALEHATLYEELYHHQQQQQQKQQHHDNDAAPQRNNRDFRETRSSPLSSLYSRSIMSAGCNLTVLFMDPRLPTMPRHDPSWFSLESVALNAPDSCVLIQTGNCNKPAIDCAYRSFMVMLRRLGHTQTHENTHTDLQHYTPFPPFFVSNSISSLRSRRQSGP